MDILKIYNWKDLPEYYSGILEYSNGKYHREDGYVIIGFNDTLRYFINGEDITEEFKKCIE